jgi:hypothetical protein
MADERFLGRLNLAFRIADDPLGGVAKHYAVILAQVLHGPNLTPAITP